MFGRMQKMHASPRFSRTKTNVSKHSTRDTRHTNTRTERELRVRQAPALKRRRCTEHATTGRVHETKNNKNQNTRARAPVAPHSFKGNDQTCGKMRAHMARYAHQRYTQAQNSQQQGTAPATTTTTTTTSVPSRQRQTTRPPLLHQKQHHPTVLLKNPRQIHSPPCSPTTGLFRKDTEDKISPRLHPSLFPSPTPAKLNVTDEIKIKNVYITFR